MRMLVCYDYDHDNSKLLDIAKAHAQAFKAYVHVVSSYPETYREGGGKRKAEQLWEDVEKIERQLREAKDFFDEAGIACGTHLSTRGLNPGEDLVQYARENDIDSIVLGIRKRSKMDKLIFGSTAQYILLNTKCPVVAVPLSR